MVRSNLRHYLTLFVAVLVAAEAAEGAEPTCPADDPAACREGDGTTHSASLLQRAQSTARLALPSETLDEEVAELAAVPNSSSTGTRPQNLTDLPEHEAPMLAEDGSFPVKTFMNIPVPNWGGNCGGPFKVNVYLPGLNAGRKPLIAFSHGFGQGGPNVQSQLLPNFLERIVSQGFVVIAHQTGASNWCNTGIELIHVLNWAKSSAHKTRIDWNRVAVMGYSMGGYFVTFFAEHQALIDGYKVKAAIALHPPCQAGCKPQVKTAMYWGSGSSDTTAPPAPVRQSYDQMNTRKGKVFVNIPGAPHWEVGKFGQNRHVRFVLSFLRCQLLNNRGACNDVYNNWPSERP